MKHVFTDPQALLAELSKEMLSAMQEVDEKGKAKAKANAKQFYSQGSPKRYDRTGKYGDAPDSTGAQGGGGHVSTEIYMNESGHGYTTGTSLLEKFGKLLKTIHQEFLVSLVDGHKQSKM